MKLEALTPRDDLYGNEDSFVVYKDYLDKAFDNPKIRNLALSGSLGSGKSSIIRSYDRVRNKGEKHFLYVSLMSFSNQNNETNTDNQKQLEYSLLKQIMSYCTEKELPEGSVSGIPEKFNHLRLCATSLSVLFFLVYTQIFHEQFGMIASSIAENKLLGFLITNFHSSVHFGIYLVIGLVLSYYAYRILCRCLPFFQLSKFTLKANNAEAEVFIGKEPTSLDVYMFELAYALEQLGEKYNHTVIFEDLEHLDSTIALDIMEKLRELNVLTNNHIQSNNKNRICRAQWWDHNILSRIKSIDKYRYFFYETNPQEFKRHYPRLFKYYDKMSTLTPIRFVYAIDERTVPAEYRTKFYDCIIPVVPVSHPLNCREKFNKMLDEFDFDSEAQTKLCEALSDAFADYRTLLTLQNEFQVLYSLCQTNNEKEYADDPHNKVTLFAITAYKVLLPEWFELALSPQGTQSLHDFSSETDRDALVQRGRKKASDAVRKLFEQDPSDSTSLLDSTSLRLILGEHELVKQWMTILQNALDRNNFVNNDTERIQKVTENLAYYFTSNKAYPTQEPYKTFRQTMTTRLHNLASEGKETQFLLVANSLAAVSRADVAEEWVWLMGDPSKGLLRNSIRFLSTSHTKPSVTPKNSETSFSDWCIESMKLYGNKEMCAKNSWNNDMANTLMSYLPTEDPLFWNHNKDIAMYLINDQPIANFCSHRRER